MFNTFTLEYPYALLFILLFIIVNYFRSQENAFFYMPHTHLLSYLKRPNSHVDTFLQWAIICFSVLALSNPLYYKKTTSVKQNAIDIVLALDTSGSMSMYGFNPSSYTQTRLDVVKEVVVSFINNRINDRVGLVAFGTHASIVSPLSFDKSSQKSIVKNLTIGSLGKSTALIDALVSSTLLLKKAHLSLKSSYF